MQLHISRKQKFYTLKILNVVVHCFKKKSELGLGSILSKITIPPLQIVPQIKNEIDSFWSSDINWNLLQQLTATALIEGHPKSDSTKPKMGLWSQSLPCQATWWKSGSVLRKISNFWTICGPTLRLNESCIPAQIKTTENYAEFCLFKQLCKKECEKCLRPEKFLLKAPQSLILIK